jgi:hypothetical protein
VSAPAWAERIVKDVARSRRRRPPPLRWRRVRKLRSAGSADVQPDRDASVVSIAAGRDSTDQRLVLCHELAHWLGSPDDGHTMAFWLRAWGLYRRYRVPIHYALAREGAYEGAVQAYGRLLKERSSRRQR